MSQANVEIVRASFAAFNEGKMDVDAVREWLHPDVIIVRALEGWPEPAPIVGRDAVIRQWQRIMEPWPDPTVELVSIIDAGDRVVTRQIAHGKGHGPEIKIEFTVVNTFRNGKVFLIEYFWDHAEALEILGLSE
jgi:ketosteroid isomerase-like protein